MGSKRDISGNFVIYFWAVSLQKYPGKIPGKWPDGIFLEYSWDINF